LTRRVTPSQPVAIDEDYAAQNPSIIDPRLAMALRKERLQPLHLRVGQPEKVAHHHPRQFGSLNHAARAASSKSMGPDPNNYARKHDLPRRGRQGGAAIWQKFRVSIWAMSMPILLIIGARGGFFTVTEIGAVLVIYAIFVGWLIH